MSEPNYIIRILRTVTLGTVIGLFAMLCFLISLTQIQMSGVNYTPVEHFETYNHCGGE